jgi:hypothetical protein
MDGFVKTAALYNEKLADIRAGREPALENSNFDIGKPSHFGVYRLADEACGKLVQKLADQKFSAADADLRKAILQFYGNEGPAEPKAAAALEALRSAN